SCAHLPPILRLHHRRLYPQPTYGAGPRGTQRFRSAVGGACPGPWLCRSESFRNFLQTADWHGAGCISPCLSRAKAPQSATLIQDLKHSFAENTEDSCAGTTKRVPRRAARLAAALVHRPLENERNFLAMITSHKGKTYPWRTGWF